jgi:hypothetical protein
LIYSHWRDKNLKRSDESFPPLAYYPTLIYSYFACHNNNKA